MANRDRIQHVSDTARWVALYRAMESERPDALFQDRFARRLAGENAERLLDSIPKGRKLAWPVAVRTAVLDEQIQRVIHREGVDTVLNLAAGLDTRPFRLPLPPSLRWIEVDFPDVIAYKQERLAGETPACELEHVGFDLTDLPRRQAFFAGVGAASRQVLVLSEGLLVYLPPDKVAQLATDLAAVPSFRWWLIDISSPRLLKMLEKTWGKTLSQGNAPFLFAPPESTRFFTSLGWKEAEYRAMWDEANRLHRAEVPFAWLWNFLARFQSAAKKEEGRRMSGMALLERKR